MWLGSREQMTKALTRPGGYKTCFMLNSTEHGISIVHKSKMLKNKDFSSFQTLRCFFTMLINVKMPTAGNCSHFNIYEHDKFYAQLC